MRKKNNLPKLIVVLGPTGSGKTGLALELCKKFNGEIISADSRQIYREMDIGTAKEGETARISGKTVRIVQNIPQYMIDIAEPGRDYTVGQFKKDVEEIIDFIIKRGKIPFLVGGTGLYIDAVVENFQFPDTVGAIHESPKLKNKELSELVKMLLKKDPDAEFEVDLKNRRRVERALEVCLATGKPFTKQKTRGERKYNVLKLGIKQEKEELHKKINKRVKEMVEEGLLEEVEKLAKKYGWDNEAMTGIGYREFKEYFSDPEGNADPRSLRKAIEQIKIDTRRYAKRQMTWFKKDKEINWVEKCKDAEGLVKKFLL